MDARNEASRRTTASSGASLSLLLVVLASALVVASQSQVVVSVGLKRRQSEILKHDARIRVSNDYENVTFTNDNEDKWPLLNELIDDDNSTIITNVEFLVDFAIVGHPKTGTSSLMRLLASHPDVAMHTREIRLLRKGKPADFVRKMYELPPGFHYKRGYKAPNEISSPTSLESLRKYFPNTKLIVGVRHPVKWFESWYNFKVRQEKKLPPAETLVGENLPHQVQYHTNLVMLGKTNNPKSNHVRPMNNKVLLYDVSQPFNKNETRADIFRTDLSHFLGLSTLLDPPKTRRNQSRNVGFAIDICDDKYTELRMELVQHGTAAAKWIQTYFMVHPDVTVSSPEYFQEVLSTWSRDPCDSSF